MAEKSASSNNGAQGVLVLLLIVGLLILLSGKFSKGGGPSSRDAKPATAAPSVRKFIGEQSRQDRLETKDRKQLQDLLDKVGK